MNISLSKKSFTPPNNGEEIFRTSASGVITTVCWAFSLSISSIILILLMKIIEWMNLSNGWIGSKSFSGLIIVILTLYIKFKFLTTDEEDTLYIVYFDDHLLIVRDSPYHSKTTSEIDYKVIDNITILNNFKNITLTIKDIETLKKENYISPLNDYSVEFSNYFFMMGFFPLSNEFDKVSKKYRGLENELVGFLNRKVKGEYINNDSSYITSSNNNFSPIKPKDGAGIR